MVHLRELVAEGHRDTPPVVQRTAQPLTSLRNLIVRRAEMRGRKATQASKERICIGYVRVSTEEQANEGVSLAAQEDRIRAYAALYNYELAEIVVDAGESAKSLKRPGISRILDGVRSGNVKAVIALKLDRITRSVRDLGDLMETFDRADAALVSVSENLDTSTAAGRMVTNMLGVVAQWEREAIGERTATALTHKRKNGYVYGRTPFGYRRVDDRLVEVPQDLAAREEARAMLAAGASLRQVGTYLRGHDGGAWHAQTVKDMLGSRMSREQVTAS
jgi:site-specific DNA recombinase